MESQIHGFVSIFSPRKVCVSDYFLRSDFNDFPQGWNLEGSNDLTEWEMIDQQSNQKCLSSGYAEHIFQCVSYEFYSYLRITQTQKTSDYHGDNFLLTYVEFAGKITNSE